MPEAVIITPVAQHLDAIDARIAELERRIRLFEHYATELEALRRIAGDLKFELEQMRE
jgi:hypothetical protein